MARTRIPGSTGQVVGVGKAPRGVKLLGRLVTYSFPDGDGVPGPKTVRTWAKHGLDVDLLPQQRQGYDIFRSACRSVESRRHNGHQVEVRVDEVLHDANECVYQITRLVRDRKNRIIEHPKAMTIAYEKATDTITVRELEDYDALRGLEERIRDHYAKNAKNIPGQKFRNAVSAVLAGVNSQKLRPKGGLYFVPDTFRKRTNGRTTTESSVPVLEGLAGVLQELFGDRSDFWTLPLVNEETAQAMVRKHFTINVCERSREAMERALQRVRAGKGQGRGPRSDFVANLWNERRQIAGAIDEFDSLVTLERDDIDKNLRDLDDALEKLQALADAPEEGS